MKTIQYENKTIHIISTAHVSLQSVIEVKEAIELIQPEVVCIELDDQRAKNLNAKPSNPDIIEIIKQKKMGTFAANLILSSYQKKMAQEIGSEVGGEMKQAMKSAKEFNIPVRNIDRDVQTTFKRIWAKLGFFKRINLFATLVLSAFSSEKVEEDDIEKLKESDLLFEAVKELDDKLPEVSQVLLHERNQYMAEKIKALPYNNIIAVIGAAHTEGMIEAFNQSHSIRDLEFIPNKKKINWAQWIIPVVIVSLLTLLTLKTPNVGLKQLFWWFILSSGSATLSTIFLKAHPLTTLTTLVTAPIGTLSPVLAVGFFAGLMEAYQRPPKVSDFESLHEDVSHFKMWFKNKVLRVILIFIITNLMSSLGTFIALGSIISKLLK